MLVLSSLVLFGGVNSTLRGQATGPTTFVKARVLTESPGRAPAFADASIVVRDGRITSVTPPTAGTPPAGARVVDLGGKFVTPGFISAHAHVSDVNGLKPRAYTDENTRRQLGVFARYGITTVWSLGGEQAPAFALRDAQDVPALDRARIFVAGDVITGAHTRGSARRGRSRRGAQPDVIKIAWTTTSAPPRRWRRRCIARSLKRHTPASFASRPISSTWPTQRIL
jgi:imidazolonepropionase-like amidohydrolase